MASGYLLDSCAVIAAIRGEPRSLLNRLATIPPSRVFLSALVRAELLYGAEKSRLGAQSRASLHVIEQGCEPLPFDADDAMAYARIRAALERKGASIGPMDSLIAAQAVARGLVLVTDNLREFRRVPGLTCENWMR
ncbi:MAG: type II toxin-antitoxin system VapC family toxin [Rhodanobacteraceae bacterium]|nr:MAG: type II toxin-antitoxin system VapC family toxin [Rhodanobacteraceae bacterium]